MGIQGLLPLLKSIMVPFHIKQLDGCYVAVDTYSWLHKGALCCSKELCKGIPTSRHIEYCMRRVNLLRHFGVKPILVFDGGLLPMKSEQENKRARVRKENFARAVEHESDGNSAAAFECYQKAVDISPLVACELIQVLKQENVHYIVAPYEADAQMTFLATSKQVEAVITEDSDLIPFGCPRIIFKMDKLGQAVEYRYSMLQKNKELSFEGFNRQMLLEMCILSGCDYLQSLPGMGPKRAHAIIKRLKSYDKVLKHLRFSGVSVPPFYEDSFKKAILTFKYQRVYDPINEDIVHLSDISDDIGDDLDFLGPSMPKNIAQGIAKGDLDPFTKMPFQVENLSAGLAIERTSQLKISHSESGNKKIDLPVQKNLLTKYFCFASIEAKRKFRAPRMSPTTTNHSTLDSSSVSPQDHETFGASATKINSSAASLVDSENLGNDPPLNKYIENSFSTKIIQFTESSCHEDTVGEKGKVPEHTILQQPRQPIHKPCMGLHKEHEHTNVEDTFEGKTRKETRKVIVRSAYFQHKHVEKNNGDKKQDCLVKADVAIDEHKNTISDSTLCNNHMKSKVLKRKISPNDNVQSENLQPTHMHPVSPCPDNGINKIEGTLANVEDTVDGKVREETRKVIVRSHYFKHKYVEKNNGDKKQDCLVKADFAIDEHKNTISDGALYNNHMKNEVLKGKISPNDSVQNENLQPRNMHPVSPRPDNGHCDHNFDRTFTEGNHEAEKFGANISHLGHYSEIAEKSMEKFVSVISSFRCTSSGSRASGLRAPLRDLRNTQNNRSTTVDFKQYAYVPKKQKTRRVGRGG